MVLHIQKLLALTKKTILAGIFVIKKGNVQQKIYRCPKSTVSIVQ